MLAVKNLIFGILQKYFVLIGTDCTTSLPEGPVLVVAPHPDDETLGCGATIARLCAEGRKVRIVIVTDGRTSTKSNVISPEDLAALRREEAKRAATVLGLSGEDVVFLNYRDSEAAQHIGAIAEDVAKQITSLPPALVLSPCHLDEHPDHRAVSTAVAKLQDEGKIACSVYQYPIWYRIGGWPYGALRCLVSPSLFGRVRTVITGPYAEIKRAALSQHRSQVENLTGEQNWKLLSARPLSSINSTQETFFQRHPRRKKS